jgi:acyl carrier protein
MAYTIDNLKDILRQEVDSRVNVDDLDPNLSLSEQGIDSLDQSSFFLSLEESTGKPFSGDDITPFNTLNKIIAILNK